jgi:hypothetical protein
MLEQIKVVSTAAVTWITATSAALVILSEEISAVAPDGSEDLVAIIVKAVAWLGAAVAIIRRVTPVLPSERGILPQGE